MLTVCNLGVTLEEHAVNFRKVHIILIKLGLKLIKATLGKLHFTILHHDRCCSQLATKVNVRIKRSIIYWIKK